MASILLKLGTFKFSIATAAFNELIKKHRWRWQGQARFGKGDLLQYTGHDSDTITLSGNIATAREGVGVGRVDELVALGNTEAPQLLVSGDGDVLGYWVVLSVDETRRRFIAGGKPRQQDFSVELKYYAADLQNP